MDAHTSSRRGSRGLLQGRTPRWAAVGITAIAMLAALMAAPTEHRTADAVIDSAVGIALPAVPDLTPASSVPHTREDLESWARHNVRGLKAIDLSELDPVTARELVSVAAELSQALRIDIGVVTPAARWNEVTGQPSAGSPMFANRYGIGFDPEWWATYRGRAIRAGWTTADAETDPHSREYAAHEIAHVWEDTASAAAPPATAAALHQLVEAYRAARGRDAVVAELGAYAWDGGSDRAGDAWRETWAEAFAHYAVEREDVSPATRVLVERGLLLLVALRPSA